MTRTRVQVAAATAAALLASLAAPVAEAAAVSVDYELVALAAPGRYEYRYTLGNLSLGTPLSWFSVDFDTSLYDEISLLITSAGLGDWSEQILHSVLADPAQYDAYKTIGAGLDIGESQSGFAVEFTWLGAGTPGSQAYTVYDPGTLDVLETGVTTDVTVGPPTDVPEPGSAALVLLALGGAGIAGRRGRARRSAVEPTPAR